MSNHDLAAVLHSIDGMCPADQKLVYDHIATKLSTDDINEAAFKKRLLESGLVREIRPPVTDLEPYRNRAMCIVAGKPVSETVIEERR